MTHNKLPIRRFKIPKTGTGYKVFSRIDDGRYNTLYFSQHRYDRTDNSMWVHWNNSYAEDTEYDRHGFFFFLDEESANFFAQNVFRLRSKHVKLNYDVVVRKIMYEDGLGEFKTNNLTKYTEGLKMCMCKSFLILKKDKSYD